MPFRSRRPVPILVQPATVDSPMVNKPSVYLQALLRPDIVSRISSTRRRRNESWPTSASCRSGGIGRRAKSRCSLLGEGLMTLRRQTQGGSQNNNLIVVAAVFVRQRGTVERAGG